MIKKYKIFRKIFESEFDFQLKNEIKDIFDIAVDEGLKVGSSSWGGKRVVYVSQSYKYENRIGMVSDDRFITINKEIHERLDKNGFLGVKKSWCVYNIGTDIDMVDRIDRNVIEFFEKYETMSDIYIHFIAYNVIEI